ncbi:hypothetical protein [Haladaptatus caseinilyticus]|uniref:hypothetical protein n=1 Tax=Haladaptatus caseinilyticus TaxID=2993314 RepID=UPI00224B017F|nr:hypothetical protein [Haladaptatus caseinilyticus]
MGTVNDSTSESGSSGRGSDHGAFSIVTEPLLRVLLAIRGSFLLFIASVGVLFIVTGATIMDEVLAGMFGIWGVSCLLYAGLGYGLLKLIGYH